MKKISIIIPIYNTEKYLKECIESILIDKFMDYEIILVNDGSNDGSGEICDYYSNKYDFIKVIHKKNGGLSSARNAGIEVANGKYVLFIDSDDFIAKDSLFNINKIIDESIDVDLIFLEALKFINPKKVIPLGEGYKKELIINKNQNQVLEHIAGLNKFPASACTKLVKLNLIKKNKIYFKEGQLSEDIEWSIRVLINSKKFNYCDFKYYYYRQNREGSITNNLNIKNFKSILDIIENWSNKDNKSNITYQKFINSFMAYEFIMLLTIYGVINKNEREKFKKKVKSFDWLLKCSKAKRVVLIKNIYKIIGIEGVSIILSKYLALRN